MCILVDYWVLKGLEFTGAGVFSEQDIVDSIAGYILKQKGNSKFKETFKFYVRNSQLKIIILTQLFRIFAKVIEPPRETPPEKLETEKEKDDERERLKAARTKIKAMTTAFMDLFVMFIYENLENNIIREYILLNLGPFIKSKQVSFQQYFPEYIKKMLDFIGLNHSLNLFDMNFIIQVINNSFFDLKKTFAILDGLVNLFFLSIPQARFILICINTLLKKIDKNEPVCLADSAPRQVLFGHNTGGSEPVPNPGEEAQATARVPQDCQSAGQRHRPQPQRQGDLL